MVGVHEDQPVSLLQKLDQSACLDAEMIAPTERHLIFLFGTDWHRVDRVGLKESGPVSSDYDPGLRAIVQKLERAE